MSLEEALAFAVKLHRDGARGGAGALAQARTVYERILVARPDHVDARQFLGILLHQQGDSAAGVGHLQRAVAARPDDAGLHNNLGNVYKESGRRDEAVGAYLAALARDPHHIDALNNLGVTYRALGRIDEALAVYRQAISLAPSRADLRNNYAHALLQCGQGEAALDELRTALRHEPSNEVVCKAYGTALVQLGALDAARDHYRQWLVRVPGDPVATHMLAALTDGAAPARASDGYLRVTFDAFAPNFDDHLAQVAYRAPAVLADALTQMGSPSAALDVLDLGCGTGLCGGVLRPYARSLTGVDLSPAMLARARSRGVYDSLVEAEITSFLSRHPNGWDLIAAADTINYFGELSSLFAALAAALRPGGAAWFSAERRLSDGPSGIERHGRYSHHDDHLRAVLLASGLTVVTLSHEPLRREGGAVVEGTYVRCHRPPA